MPTPGTRSERRAILVSPRLRRSLPAPGSSMETQKAGHQEGALRPPSQGVPMSKERTFSTGRQWPASSNAARGWWVTPRSSKRRRATSATCCARPTIGPARPAMKQSRPRTYSKLSMPGSSAAIVCATSSDVCLVGQSVIHWVCASVQALRWPALRIEEEISRTDAGRPQASQTGRT